MTLRRRGYLGEAKKLVKFKKTGSVYPEYDILVDGKKVATFRFQRFSATHHDRASHEGWLKLDGSSKKEDLGHFAFFDDVKRYLLHRFSQENYRGAR